MAVSFDTIVSVSSLIMFVLALVFVFLYVYLFSRPAAINRTSDIKINEKLNKKNNKNKKIRQTDRIG